MSLLDNNPATGTISMCTPGPEEVWSFERLAQRCGSLVLFKFSGVSPLLVPPGQTPRKPSRRASDKATQEMSLEYALREALLGQPGEHYVWAGGRACELCGALPSGHCA